MAARSRLSRVSRRAMPLYLIRPTRWRAARRCEAAATAPQLPEVRANDTSGVGIAAVLACRLAGCTVGPKYKVPDVPLTPAYKEADGWKAAHPSDQALRGPWWEMFGDPQLNALEQQVPGGNQNLRGLEARFREARAAIRFNRASEFPTISTAPSIASIRESANRPYLPAGAARAKGDLVLPFDVSWELDFWGRVRRTVSAAREFAQASAADLETAKLSLQAELAFDYFELRSADV